MTRHKIRENIFRILFESGFHDAEEFDRQFDNYIECIDEEPTEEEIDEMRKKVLAVKAKIEEIDPLIADSAKGWKLNRISNADLNIMRLAIYEILYDDDVPMKVAINEAVELAKVYGMDNSPSFINGILSKVVSE